MTKGPKPDLVRRERVVQAWLAGAPRSELHKIASPMSVQRWLNADPRVRVVRDDAEAAEQRRERAREAEAVLLSAGLAAKKAEARAERLDEARRLREEGMSLAKIGEHLGVSRQRVHQMIKADDPDTVQLLPNALALAREGICPICGKGPWKVLRIHVTRKHQVPAHDLADLLGVPWTDTIFVAPDTREALRDLAVERDQVSRARGHAVPMSGRPMSKAGRRRKGEGGRARGEAAQMSLPDDVADRLRADAIRVAEARRATVQAVVERDRGIVEAIEQGAAVSAVAKASGLTGSRIADIVAGRNGYARR